MPPVSLWLYNIGMVAFLCLGWPVVLVWLALVPKHRAGWRQKMGWYTGAEKQWFATLPSANHRRVWLHAVSVGEFNAIRPVVKALLEDGHQVVVTTTTKTGQGLAQQLLGHQSQACVVYCPWDTRLSVQLAVNTIRPDVLLIAETELWPNLIDVAQSHCPVLLINARLSQNSYQGYRWLRWLVSPMLRQLTAILAQSDGDAERYRQLGAPSVQVMGNLKLDVGQTVMDEARLGGVATAMGLSIRVPQDKPNTLAPVVVLASTHPGEEALFIPWLTAFFKRYPQGRCIVAPRHPERADDVAQLLVGCFSPQTVACRSAAKPGVSVTTPLVVLDTIGELVAAYALADVAIIGGSFTPKRGGQNPLEAIGQTIPVVYGPYMANFKPVVALLQAGRAGVQVESAQQAGEKVLAWLGDSAAYRQQTAWGSALLAQHQGVTQQLLAKLDPYLGQ